MYEIDILQVLWYDDIKFYPDFVDMFDNRIIPNTNLKILFVTPYQRVFDELKQYKNVKLCTERQILRLFKKSRWIFLHPLSLSKLKTILLDKKVASKIIWRTWGHDIRLLNKHDIFHELLFSAYVNKIKQFRAIGVANEIDCENVEKVFGSTVETVTLNYFGTNQKYYSLKKIENEPVENKNQIRIMIGHNGGIADNHFELINLMQKFKNEDVVFSFPLSYGDKKRIENIKQYAISKLGAGKCEFIETFVPFEEYARYVKNIDVALMDQEYSNALGNISILIYFHKKIYVNDKGDFARSFRKKGIEVNYTGDIKNQTFEQFYTQGNFQEKYNEYISHGALVEIDATLKKWVAFINELYGAQVIKISF